jgi:arylsulfatase A-like enzyme
MYDGGTREPLLARLPGVIAAGATCDTPVTSPDLYPTLLDLAGLPARPDPHRDGTSFAPELRGNATPERPPLFWHYPHYSNQGGTPGCAIRDGRYKLLRFFEYEPRALYDLDADPGEHFNLADQLPQKAAELDARLERWLTEIEATLPRPNPDYVPRPDPCANPTV